MIAKEPLYKIEGGNPKDQARVQEAIDILCSKEALYFGELALHKSYELHGKVVTIVISDGHDNFYDNLLGENTINIAPDDFRDKLLACRLARELTHATQPDYQDRAMAITGLDGLEQKYYSEYNGLHGEKNKSITMENPAKMVDKVLLPMAKWMKKKLASDPVYLKYHAEIIEPALENEKKVAELLGINIKEPEIGENIATKRKEILRNYQNNAKFGEFVKKGNRKKMANGSRENMELY